MTNVQRPIRAYLQLITAPEAVQAEVERQLELIQPQPRKRPARWVRRAA